MLQKVVTVSGGFRQQRGQWVGEGGCEAQRDKTGQIWGFQLNRKHPSHGRHRGTGERETPVILSALTDFL